MSLMLRVTDVEPLDGHRLRVAFNDASFGRSIVGSCCTGPSVSRSRISATSGRFGSMKTRGRSSGRTGWIRPRNYFTTLSVSSSAAIAHSTPPRSQASPAPSPIAF